MLIAKFNDLENVYHIEDLTESDHIVTLQAVENLPEDTSGFYLSRVNKSDNWDYSAFNTVYRVIDKKTIQYSNDGSVYVIPKIDITVQAIFNDGDNAYGVRPDEVTVDFLNNGKKSFDDVLKKSKNYTIIHKDRLSNRTYSIKAPDIPVYRKEVSGTTVTYSIDVPQPRIITTDDTSKAIMDLFEGNETSQAICNIYAAYCESNEKNYADVPEAAKSNVAFVIDKDGFVINEDGTCSIKPINQLVEG